MKTACVIQGNIRVGTYEIINEMKKHFDIVILSTWQNEEILYKKQDIVILKNKFPKNKGHGNRNLQRFSTIEGLKKAKELNCNFVMKWRTDILPTRFNINIFFDKSKGAKNEYGYYLVCPFFRILTAKPCVYSTIPDIFMFGHIDMMMDYWDDVDVDYSLEQNIPQSKKEILNNLHEKDKYRFLNYTTEAELFLFFQEKINRKNDKNLSHAEIVRNYFNPIEHELLHLVWFDNKGDYRAIDPTTLYKWWNREIYEGKKNIPVYDYLDNHEKKRKSNKLKNIIYYQMQKIKQIAYYKIYKDYLLKSKIKNLLYKYNNLKFAIKHPMFIIKKIIKSILYNFGILKFILSSDIKGLHLGGHNNVIEGFINIDANLYTIADIKSDINKIKLQDNSVEIIYTSHTLEHLPRNLIVSSFKEYYRVLKKGGKLYFSVPNFEFLSRKILEEVDKENTNYKLVDILIGIIFGGQINQYDYHFNGFIYKTLKKDLLEIGFSKVDIFDPDKLYFKNFRDSSSSKIYDDIISLNIIAEK